MLQQTILGLFLVLISQFANCQDITFSKSTIRADEEFTITLTFPKDQKKSFQSFSFPEIQGFVKVKTQFEEEKKTKIYTIIQSYKPFKSGKFKLLPFKITFEENTLTSPGVTITVMNTPVRKSIPSPEFASAEFKTEKEEIYFRILTDKNSVYAGEGFTVSACLLIGENNKTGFTFFDLNEQVLHISRSLATTNCLIDEYSKGMIEQPRFDTVRIDHKLYQKLTFFEAKAYPINSTDFKFPSVEFKLFKYLTARSKNDILWKAEEIKLIAPPRKIWVKDLPPHPLKDKVSVGTFQVKENISSAKVKTGESFRYMISIFGNDNLSAVMAPEIRENESLDFYSPGIKQYNIITKEKIRTGQKVFTYDIIPKEPGNYRLSDYFQWIYFDPLHHKYDTLQSEINLIVTGESQKNKEISSTDLGSFYELAGKESNKLRSKEKDQSIKFFANIIILFMLVTTAILIFRR